MHRPRRSSRRPSFAFAVRFLLLLSCVVFGLSSFRQSLGSHPLAPDDALSPGGEVHGIVLAVVDGEEIELPSVSVSLIPQSKALPETASVLTELAGEFVIPSQPQGSYLLRAQAPGFLTYTSPFPIVLGDSTVFADPIELTAMAVEIAGRVALADSSTPGYVNGVFDIDDRATVEILNSSHVRIGGPVYLNDLGEFVVAGVSASASIVRASFQGLVASVDINPSFMLHADFMFANSAPVIELVVAAVGDTGVRRVAPGTLVNVTVMAADPDGDKLHYQWLPSEYEGSFVSVDGPSVPWQVPSSPGIYSMHVLVNDGHSHVLQSMQLIAGSDTALFSGVVQSPGGDPVSGAMVTVNGDSTATDTSGFFLIQIAEHARYVLTISKFGYALRSDVLYDPLEDSTYELAPAQVFYSLDPESTNTIAVAGVELTIPANSLADQDGVLASGPVNASLFGIPFTDPGGHLPGEDVGRDSSALMVRLVGEGAVDIQIRDTAGRIYNLAQGAQAILRLPASNPGLSAPPQIPVWTYDGIEGIWNQAGTATLIGDTYTATLSHFSVLQNSDQKPDVACIRVIVDPATIPLKGRIRYVSGGKTSYEPLNVPVNLSPAFAPNASVEITVVKDEDNTEISKTFDVRAGDAIAGGPGQKLLYPYNECNGHAFLTQPLNRRVKPDRFLKKPTNINPEARAYNQRIDQADAFVGPQVDQRENLSEWQKRNQFIKPNGDPADGVVTAVYFNAGDLAFGRRMSMTKNSGNIAYYVTNFNTVTDANRNRNPLATVAMEYSPDLALPAGMRTPFMKFFVFNDKGERAFNADLDGQGPKPIPALCVNCHAGDQYKQNGTPDIRAKFLPFDLSSFEYFREKAKRGGKDGNGPKDPDLREQLRKLNAGVLDSPAKHTDPREGGTFSTATAELINGWYNNKVTEMGQAFNGEFVPIGWNGRAAHAALYNTVVKKYCRGCHISRGKDDLDWSTHSQFDDYRNNGLMKEAVCNALNMPHALVTYLSFWNDADAVRALSGFLGGCLTEISLPTPTQIALVEANAWPEEVRLVWFYPGGGGVEVIIYRREGADWSARGRAVCDGTGRIAFVDRDVLAGAHYDYRLGIPGPHGERYEGEGGVDVPKSHALALGRIRPNPTASDLVASFTLPGREQAKLELFDVAGRRLFELEVGSSGAGHHLVTMARAGSLGPGVYLVRLTQGAHSLSTKATVMR